MKKDSLGNRMKSYENIFRNKLIPRTPVIIRIDGKAFHSFTKNLSKPFCDELIKVMDYTAQKLLESIQNTRCAYVQSDEISILLIDYNKYNSQQWFNGNIQKIVSISASMATVFFNELDILKYGALFDSRVFNLSENEVNNYFIWRQQDAVRNSIQMVAQSLYSHKELNKKDCNVLQEMIFKKDINWNNFSDRKKRGGLYIKNTGYIYPDFKKEPNIIKNLLEVEEK